MKLTLVLFLAISVATAASVYGKGPCKDPVALIVPEKGFSDLANAHTVQLARELVSGKKKEGWGEFFIAQEVAGGKEKLTPEDEDRMLMQYQKSLYKYRAKLDEMKLASLDEKLAELGKLIHKDFTHAYKSDNSKLIDYLGSEASGNAIASTKLITAFYQDLGVLKGSNRKLGVRLYRDTILPVEYVPGTGKVRNIMTGEISKFTAKDAIELQPSLLGPDFFLRNHLKYTGNSDGCISETFIDDAVLEPKEVEAKAADLKKPASADSHFKKTE